MCGWFSALLRGEWSEAVELIMKPREGGQFHSFMTYCETFTNTQYEYIQNFWSAAVQNRPCALIKCMFSSLSVICHLAGLVDIEMYRARPGQYYFAAKEQVWAVWQPSNTGCCDLASVLLMSHKRGGVDVLW